MNISIRYKMAIPLLIVITLFSSVAMFNMSIFKKQAEINSKLTTYFQPVSESVEDGYRDFYQMASAAQALLLSLDNKAEVEKQIFEFEDNAYKAVPRMEKVQMLYDAHLLPNETKSTLTKLIQSSKKLVALYEPIIENPQSGPLYYENNLQNLSATFDDVRRGLKAVSKVINKEKQALEQESIDAAAIAKLVVEVGTGLAVFTAFIISLLLSNWIVGPIKRLEIALSGIASGDGDLSKRVIVESKDEIGMLAESFNEFVSKVHQTVIEVIDTSITVRSEMNNIKSTTKQTVISATDQEQESEVVAAAVHEMRVTSETVNDRAMEAVAASQKATIESEDTNKILAKTVETIEDLSVEIDRANTVIQTLDSDVSNISSILDVIKGIADQTNLLALNAAIEAARAGDQGRGFAVVADEVRALASKTQSSTAEIETMIEHLQSGAKEAVSVMRISRENGLKTISTVGTASESITEVSRSIHIINDMNMHIATAASQQSQVSADVNRNVQKIADNSHLMVGRVNSIESACLSLSEQCEKLDGLVAHFKV
ncbi:MAG: methyl-accepting chemotaxis protein [Aliivibrio sp.]|nr:methyl-accepting chemotaxis protein [Aliivibrio sp.]